MKGVEAFSGRIGLPPVAMGWAASCDDIFQTQQIYTYISR